MLNNHYAGAGSISARLQVIKMANIYIVKITLLISQKLKITKTGEGKQHKTDHFENHLLFIQQQQVSGQARAIPVLNCRYPSVFPTSA